MKLADEVILWLFVAVSIIFFLLLLFSVFALAPGRESRKERARSKRKQRIEQMYGCEDCPVWLVCHLDEDHPCVKDVGL